MVHKTGLLSCGIALWDFFGFYHFFNWLLLWGARVVRWWKTVHSSSFFCKIVEIDRFALRPAILHECQNYLEGNFFSPPSPYSYNPRCPPPWYIWKSSWPPLTVRCAVSRWSHEKIGDCEQATVMRALASHQCGPSWNPIVYTICGLNLLLIFLPCSGYSSFPLFSKTNTFKFQ